VRTLENTCRCDLRKRRSQKGCAPFSSQPSRRGSLRCTFATSTRTSAAVVIKYQAQMPMGVEPNDLATVTG
jgi:hypothetical protein